MPYSVAELSQSQYLETFEKKADKLLNQFIWIFFVFGFAIAPIYNTYAFAAVTGGLSVVMHLFAQYVVKQRYAVRLVNSIVLAIFMLQFIGQMNGMYEMHFFFFTNIALLVLYMDWRLVVYYTILAIAHHTFFFYLNSLGDPIFGKYFINDVEVDAVVLGFHYGLAIFMAVICGYFAHLLKTNRISDYQQKLELVSTMQALDLQRNNLSAAVADLELRNREADLIAYKTVHDLKAPLSNIEGLIELMRLNPSEKDWDTYSNMLQQSVSGLRSFITHSLEAAKNEKVEIVRSPVNLKEFIQAILKKLTYSRGFAEINFELRIPEDLGRIHTDEFRLNLILSNIISNAIKYRDPKKTDKAVIFVGSESKVDFRISITDNGLGIPSNQIDNIFKPYNRAHNNVEGSGLGLHIVQQAVNKIGGQISVQSTEGISTTFTLIIPKQVKALG